MSKMVICDVCGRALPKEQTEKFWIRRQRRIFQKKDDVCFGCIRELFRMIEPGETKITAREWENIADLASIRRSTYFSRSHPSSAQTTVHARTASSSQKDSGGKHK